ncbi:MAG TPA: hypothetical protein V6D28_08130 [Leptolyngbyaceae cyanobacterium]
MYKLNALKFSTFLAIAFSITASTAIRIITPELAFAQINLDREISARIPAGTIIPVKYNAAQRIIVAPDEPAPIPLNLTVAKNVVSPHRNLFIPSDTQIVGELVTMQEIGMAQFVAKQLILSDGRQISISASSRPIGRTLAVTNNPRIGRSLTNTALGTAAAAAIAAVTGNPTIASQSTLLNSGFGSTPELIGRFRNLETVRLISIDPEKDLTLILNSDLILRGLASKPASVRERR